MFIFQDNYFNCHLATDSVVDICERQPGYDRISHNQFVFAQLNAM